MKFTNRGLLIFFWILLNVYIFSACAITYILAWRDGYHFQSLVSHEQVVQLSKSAFREQLAKFLVESDDAERGLIRAIFLLTRTWTITATLNISLVVLYLYLQKKNAFTSTPPLS